MRTRATTRGFRPWRGIAFVAALVAFSLVGSGVWAYWSAGSGTGGSGAATATSVGAGATPTATWSGTTVHLSWSATTLSSGTAVSGYVVKRYNATTLVQQTILTACNGTITALSCTESSVPSGQWRYSITPVFATNWTGAESPLSTVVYTDPVPPVNNLSLSDVVGGAAISGTTAYYRGNVAGSFTITNALTDVGSGPASSSTSALGGTTTGWTHTPTTLSTPTGGPYVSNSFSWSAGTTSSPTETVTGRDLANNTATVTGSLVNDSTAPTGSISYTNGYQAGRFVTVTFSGADTGSGLLSAQLQRQSANFRNGGCAAFGAFTNIGAANPVSPFTDGSVTNSKCYNYRYVLTDQVGNTFTATSTNTAWVDYAGAVRFETAGILSQLRLGEVGLNGSAAAVDGVGANDATYVNSPTLGVNGDPQNDPDTAVRLNGSTQYIQAASTAGLPTGAASRSVELWFKTTSTAHQSLFTYGSRANTEEFGLWIDAGGASLSAWGFGGGNDPVFTPAQSVEDGKWHQVVETYNGTALTLYVDGLSLGAQNVTRNTVIDGYGLQIGDVVVPGDGNSGFNFSGSLDEFSIYTTALSATDVLNHFQLGANQGVDSTGPVGGSVTATGLTGTGALYSTSTTLNLALVRGTDASGLSASAAYLYRATATLTSSGNADGICGTFGDFSLVASDPSASYADAVADNACYAYRYAVPDVLGNYTTYASGMIKVDSTAPSAPVLSSPSTSSTYFDGETLFYRTSGAPSGSSFVLNATAADTSSGITTPYLFPSLGSSWQAPSVSGSSATYKWTTAPNNSGSASVGVTNNAGSSATTPFQWALDNDAPTGVSFSYPTTNGRSVVLTSTSGTDALSGIATVSLQRSSESAFLGICGLFGGYGSYTQIVANPSTSYTDTPPTGACYKYQFVVTDHVGNVTTITPGNVLTDP